MSNILWLALAVVLVIVGVCAFIGAVVVIGCLVDVFRLNRKSYTGNI